MDNFTFKHLFRTMLSTSMLILFCFNAVASSENMNVVSTDTQTPQKGTIQISGTVSDKAGPLPGVNVTVEGTTIGVSTDEKGEYKIMVPSEKSVLEFRFIGYLPQKVVVGNRSIISITLIEDNTSMEEVTVVAFGKQKKESVIGAITTVNPAQLKRPTSNLTTSLAGNMAGIIAYQRNGEPGADNADFFVRGITTFGNNTRPLILIDGVELTTTDLARLQPDDIASFSVMKDATATALYGARGANGVILVTTKQGSEGPAKISIRLENSFSSPTKNIEVADPITYMKMYNEAVRTRYEGTGNSLDGLYSQDKIDNTIAGMDPAYYPNTDWQKELLKNYTTNQRANVSVTGGGSVARYYIAASLNHDSGMFKVDKRNNFNNNISNNSYTLRANINIDLTKTTEMAVRTSGVFDDYSGPPNGGTDMYNRVIHSNPVLFPAYYEPDEEHSHTKHIMFGNADQGQYINPYADLIRGYKQQTRSQLQSQVEVKQDLKFITEGLSIRAMVNLSRLSQFSVERAYVPFLYKTTLKNTTTGKYHLESINDNGTEYLGYGENPGDKATHSSLYFEGMANYNRTFAEKHSVSGLLVFTARNSLIANTGDLQKSLPSRNVGLSGRATYSYDNRFFAEFNFGYNGSERFSKNHRYGFFPSAGAAWVISNEKFWEKVKPVVSTLKLRYSYGLVGNDQIGDHNDRFFYLSHVEMNEWGKASSFGTDNTYRKPGINVKRYANPEITWEVSTKNNYAVEVGLWNKVMFIVDYFTEYRDNILMTRSNIPASMGLEVHPRANLGAASGQGVDMSLEYQHSFNKDLWASARGNYTFARNKYEKYEEPDYPDPWTYGVGYSIYQDRGYIAERLFADDVEAANSPRQEIGDRPYGGGDIKYTDVNNDGVVNERDKVPIGKTSLPEITYGFGFSMGYKGFDFSAFFQGQANQSFFIDATNTSPFSGETQLLKAYADSHWSEDNQDMYALWPRLSTFVHPNNNVGSTWHMRNGNFLRLKQAEIGYTLPNKWGWQAKSRISNIRIYFTGTNLLLFSKFKLWDVEMGGNGLGYPLQRVFNIGLNVTFN